MPDCSYPASMNSATIFLLCVLLLAIPHASTFCPSHEWRTHTRILASSTENSIRSLPPGTVQGPDPATRPDYENIHGPYGKTLDKIFLTVFRTNMAEKVGVDSSLPKVRGRNSLRFSRWTDSSCSSFDDCFNILGRFSRFDGVGIGSEFSF
jgi:hypothetical protein